MEPEDYDRLQAIARARRTSVADLVRIAVHDRWLTDARRQEAMESILAMNLDEDFGTPEELAREATSRFVDVH